MKNQKNNNDELLRQYLDGELNDEQESAVLKIAAGDPAMREMLRLERTLLNSFMSLHASDAEIKIPENFTDSVMSRIENKVSVQKEEKETGNSFSLFTPREMVLRPVYAAAAVLLLSIGFGYLFTIPQTGEIVIADDYETSTQVVSERESEIWIRFVYFDESAETIEVAGDFSDWDPVALSSEFIGDKQVWTGLIPVPRGEHRYMFVKDGEEWLTDPLAAVQQDDGFGNKNAILYL